MKYKCIKSFVLDKCDEDGFTVENEQISIEQESIWYVDEDDIRITCGEVRLEKIEGTNYSWLEISEETLEDCFEIVE
jgi:hypothetical protein